ncbi:TIGR01440 family protein [Halalkalibacter urbisdiaboli]|uniref:TIGR01440 family protein n=1 Tax=Halalkalibacter urbisdiaboli TaxID=1960589 RepID=UPI000B436819|nr:TIGR01440 family protein [Halalkalibacter urbisdiaboli]
MSLSAETIKSEVQQALADLQEAMPFTADMLLVVGTSTSEVIGSHIGSNGSHEVAEVIYSALKEIQQQTRIQIAFQCCEHLNRALVLEEETANARGYERVSAIPIRKAGGAMATFAFSKMDKPVLVETINAEVGIDIGDTFIGMHLRPVVVPVRSKIRSIGEAHLTMAMTRPKLIGGVRAVYERNMEHE